MRQHRPPVDCRTMAHQSVPAVLTRSAACAAGVCVLRRAVESQHARAHAALGSLCCTRRTPRAAPAAAVRASAVRRAAGVSGRALAAAVVARAQRRRRRAGCCDVRGPPAARAARDGRRTRSQLVGEAKRGADGAHTARHTRDPCGLAPCVPRRRRSSRLLRRRAASTLLPQRRRDLDRARGMLTPLRAARSPCRPPCLGAPPPLRRAPRRPRRRCSPRRIATRTASSAGAPLRRVILAYGLQPRSRSHAAPRRDEFERAVATNAPFRAMMQVRLPRRTLRPAASDAHARETGKRSACRAAQLAGPRPRCSRQRGAVHRLRLLRQQHHGARTSGQRTPCHGQSLAHRFRLHTQILSGDAIEASVGVALSLSTMAAAGCGNMVSDVLGIGISNQIEVSCLRGVLWLCALTQHRAAPAPARLRCDGLPLAAHGCTDAAAQHTEYAAARACTRSRHSLADALWLRSCGDRQPMCGRGLWLRARHVSSPSGLPRRGSGCGGSSNAGSCGEQRAMSRGIRMFCDDTEKHEHCEQLRRACV